ncbi:hypothetical protein ACFFJB_14810 [Camelimonas abortus]|uniref:Uncharacterized protein n=1 Tax=Camelimonas abortus TaxID=1017184 RepID=A0ABV7LI54_9HYPH
MGRGIQQQRINHPQTGARMTDAAITDLDRLRDMERAAVRREQMRSGGSIDDARRRVASRAGIAPGTLYNIARDRLKRLDARVRDALTAYAIKDMEREMRGLAHELEVARQVGGSARSVDLDQVEALLAEAKALLAEAIRE